MIQLKYDTVTLIFVIAIMSVGIGGIILLSRVIDKYTPPAEFKNCEKTIVVTTHPDGGIEDNSYWTCK